MLKINRDKKTFSLLETPTLAAVSILERNDLQEFISHSYSDFFKEIGQELFLIEKEVKPSDDVEDRIDLLAIGKDGTCVVVELKRGNHKLHMLQAIGYAGMISHWEPHDFMELLDDDQQEALADFLEVEQEDINRQQSIILIAEAYDYALLTGAEWLSEKYGVNITCCRISLAKDSASNSEYLVCSNVFPAPELLKVAVQRGRKHVSSSNVKWTDWAAALSGVTNAAVVTYFEEQIKNKQKCYLPKRQLLYREAGKRRWDMSVRQTKAYVWQKGRFEGDIEFWRQGLSKPEDVEPVKKGTCLRLFLNTSNDFKFFYGAVTSAPQPRNWLSEVAEDELNEVNAE